MHTMVDFNHFGKGWTYRVIKNRFLSFEINETANRAGFIVNENFGTAEMQSDFWRLILDDGLRTEIPIFSHSQTGKAKLTEDTLIIEYENLVSEYGDTYAVNFKVVVEVEDGLLKFTPYIENKTADVRINECFCPLADFTQLCGEKRKRRDLYAAWTWPQSGKSVGFLEGMTANYYSHDDKEVFWHLHYPRASMGWFGIESGNHFLYVARYDEKNAALLFDCPSEDPCVSLQHYARYRSLSDGKAGRKTGASVFGGRFA